MVMTDTARRWAEIQYYNFCESVFKIKHRPTDVLTIVQAISEITNISYEDMKSITLKILNDPYYKPYEKEVMIVGYKSGCTTPQLVKLTNRTQQWITWNRRNYMDRIQPTPKLDISEDTLVMKFMETLMKLQGGIICN